jgi:hypothetical protein
MRKSTIFISATLTTFALVLLYGVVSAYQNISTMTVSAAQVVETATSVPTAVPTETPDILTPEEAAQLAVQVVGKDSLLSAESWNLNGVDSYKITFTNNDVVYVGLDGQILGVEVAPVVVNIIQQAPAKSKNNNNNNNNSGGGGESSDDDHEEHDD